MTIGRIERGENVPKLQTLQALARGPGLELVDLLTEPAAGGPNESKIGLARVSATRKT